MEWLKCHETSPNITKMSLNFQNKTQISSEVTTDCVTLKLGQFIDNSEPNTYFSAGKADAVAVRAEIRRPRRKILYMELGKSCLWIVLSVHMEVLFLGENYCTLFQFNSEKWYSEVK